MRARNVVPIASVLFTLVAAEVFLRWAGLGGGAVELHARMLQHDPQLGWVKAPGARISYRWQGSRVVETSNSEGARGPEHAAKAPPARRRVLFLGDSFCEGYLVSDAEVFSAKYEAIAPVEAINLGVAGYSTDQQLLLHRRVAARYRAAQTVLFFFDNDVWFNALAVEHRSAKPLFKLDGDELKLTGIPVPPPNADSGSAPSAGSPESLRLFRLLRSVIRRAFPQPAGQEEETPEPSNEFLLYRRSPHDQVEAAWRLTEALLVRFAEDVRSAGSQLTILYVPNVAAVSDESLRATRKLYGMSENEWDLRLVERRLRDVCARRGIAFISPVKSLWKRTEQGETLYFMSDGHWNAAGHQAIAGILAEEL